MRKAARRFRIPRLWKSTALIVLGFCLLALGSVYAMRALPHPGCILLANSTTLDLLSGRSDRNDSSYPGYSTWLSPNSNAATGIGLTRPETNEHTLYLWKSHFQERITLQEGVLPSSVLGPLKFTWLWSLDSSRVAYLWLSMDNHYYLSVADSDGENRQTVPFIDPEGDEPGVSAAYIWGWSSDKRYLITSLHYSDDIYRDVLTFWALPDLRRVPTPLDGMRVLQGAWSWTGHDFAAVAQTANASTSLILFTPDDESDPATVPVSRFGINSLAWSPDDGHVAVASSGQNWIYDLYTRDGRPVFLGIEAERFNLILGQGNVATIKAAWSADGRTWLYVRERSTTPRPKMDLVALDIETGLHRIIAPNLVAEFVRDMFYVDPRQAPYTPTPNVVEYTIPTGQRIIIPRWVKGKIVVELANVDGSDRTRLVEGADGLMNTDQTGSSSRWWSRSGDTITVVWASGAGEARKAHLTAASPDGSLGYTVGDYANIFDARYLGNDQWIGFVGERDGVLWLELFDTKTMELHHIVGGIDDSNGWEMVDILGKNALFALITPTKADKSQGRMFYVPLDGSPSREIGDDAFAYPVWSPEGSHIAVLKQDSSRNGFLEVVDVNNGSVEQIPLRDGLGSPPWLNGWSMCQS